MPLLTFSSLFKGMKVIGFNYSSMNENSKFVLPCKNIEFLMSNYMSQHPVRDHYQAPMQKCLQQNFMGLSPLWLTRSYKTFLLQIIWNTLLPLIESSYWELFKECSSSTSMESQRGNYKSHYSHCIKGVLS